LKSEGGLSPRRRSFGGEFRGASLPRVFGGLFRRPVPAADSAGYLCPDRFMLDAKPAKNRVPPSRRVEPGADNGYVVLNAP
jgi:hypothetical protein